MTVYQDSDGKTFDDRGLEVDPKFSTYEYQNIKAPVYTSIIHPAVITNKSTGENFCLWCGNMSNGKHTRFLCKCPKIFATLLFAFVTFFMFFGAVLFLMGKI